MAEKNDAETANLVLSQEWPKELGWDGFDRALDRSFGRTARAFLDRDAALSGLDNLIADEKEKGMLPQGFTARQVTRLEFQQQAVKEVNAEFGPGGYAK